MPTMQDEIAQNIETIGASLGGLVAIGLFIKATLFQAKKIDTDTVALQSYGAIITQLRDELNQTTQQLREVVLQNQETQEKLDKVLQENKEFKIKIEQLEREKYELFKESNSLKGYLDECRKSQLRNL